MDLRFECFIYGIFSLDGICQYIGQTCNPSHRERQHLYASGSKFDNLGFTFRIIRACHAKDVNRLEKQIGKAFKRKGSAYHSKTFGGKHSNRTPAPPQEQACYIEETGEMFQKLHGNGRDFRICCNYNSAKNQKRKKIYDHRISDYVPYTPRDWPQGWDWRI